MSIDKLSDFFENITLNKDEAKIAKQILFEIRMRISAMMKLGLSYLHLDRIAGTLCGGETQRIYLTKVLGSNLKSFLYYLVKHSICISPRVIYMLLYVHTYIT